MGKKISKAKSSRCKTKKTAKKTAKKTVKKATKKTAKKTAKKTVKKATKKAAKKVAKKTAKSSASEASAAAKTTPPKKLKSPLSRAQLNKYRKMLLEKRRALLGDMSGIAAEAFRRSNGSGDLSSMPTHPADIGSDNYEQEFSLGLLESERALLEEIDDALARIADRTYGICVGTGIPISVARLNARPWSKYGIEYARMVEQGLVKPGEPIDSDDEE